MIKVHPEEIVWAKYDLLAMCEAFERVIEAHHARKEPFHNPIDTDARMALRILRGFLPYMESLKQSALRAKD